MPKGREVVQLAQEMADKVAMRVRNPAEWMIEARRIAEELELDITRCIHPSAQSLLVLCHGVVDEACKQGRATEVIRNAI